MYTYWNFDKPVYENKRYVADYAFTMPPNSNNYAQNNIENYDSILSLPEKYMTADYSKIVNGDAIFSGMKITTVPSYFNFESLEYTQNMFYNTPITTVPEMNLPNVINIDAMFKGTNIKIAELGKLHINPKKINLFRDTFWYNTKLVSLISMPNTKYCKKMDGFFSGTTNLSEVCYVDTSSNIEFHDFFLSSGISGLDWEINLQCATSVVHMFSQCNNLLDGGITLINVPRTLDLSTIGCATSKYTVKNYIETALDPSEVVD